MRYCENIWLHTYLGLVDSFLFCSICSVPKQHCFFSNPPSPPPLTRMLFPALRSLRGTMPSESKHSVCIMHLLLDAVLPCDLARPQRSVPKLCTLTFSKFQSNIARFHHQLPVHRYAFDCKERDWICYTNSPLPGRQNMADGSFANLY